MEFETFYARVSKVDKYFNITIPIAVAKFAGLEKGDRIKVIFRKIGAKVPESWGNARGVENDNL